MERKVFRLDSIDVSKMAALGDRYLIEMFELDEDRIGSILLPPRNDQERGWGVGAIVKVGNGHRLDTPDQAVFLPDKIRLPEGSTTEEAVAERQKRVSQGSYNVPFVADDGYIIRPLSTVPMFFPVGEVVFIEGYLGKEFDIQGRKYRWVGQEDVLGTTGVRLFLSAGGDWIEVDPHAPVAELGKPRVHAP